MRPRPVAVIAVMETVLCGLAVRHAHDEALHAALFLVPMAVGYRTVAASEERRLGVIPPAAALLMMLGAAIAQGWAGLILATLWMPFAMVWALMGGGLASLVRATCHGVAYVAARVSAHLRGTGGRGRVQRAAPPCGDDDRRAAEPRDVWQQIILRTPL